MTNKEAIEMLKTICGDCRLFPKCAHTESACFTALDMAIEALTHFNSESNSIKNELNELSCSEEPNESDLVKESGDLVKDLVNDCISRQDAIYYVKQATIGETDVMKAWGKAQTHLMRLPSAQPEQRWIPVSETVDVPEHEVLACDKYGTELIGFICEKDEQWMCESDECIMYDVIAWMPLPECYRGDK